MKRISAVPLFIFLMIIVSAATAQNKMTDDQKTEIKDKFEAYQKELNLSEAQTLAVEEINKEYFSALFKIRESKDKKITKYRNFKDLKTKKNKQMKEVLDKEQYKKYETFQKEIKDDFKESRRNNQ